MAAQPTVLFAEGSSLSARHSLLPLGGRYVIDVIDPKFLCQARFSKFVRRWHRCPSYSREPEAYLRFVVDRLRREKYDVLLPTHEQVFVLARFRESLSKLAGLALPDYGVLERMLSKAEFVRLLDELRLPQPESQIVKSRVEFDAARRFPCYVKLPHSTAGRGVFHVRDDEEWRQLAERLEQQGRFASGHETIVQQPARGTQCTVQAVFRHGDLVASHAFMARHVGVAGMSSARVSVDHPDVIEHVRRLGRHLEWHGAMFLDYFHSDATGPEYIEANPRIGETLNAWLCGVNLPEALVRVSLGEDVPPQPPPKSGVCTHSGFMILMTEAANGATRRQLLAEIRRQKHHEGLYENSQDELARGEDWMSFLPSAFIRGKLLLRPGMAEDIVNDTVRNYSLPESAVEVIRGLPDDLIAKWCAAG